MKLCAVGRAGRSRGDPARRIGGVGGRARCRCNRIAIIEVRSKRAAINAGPGRLRGSFGAAYTHGRCVLFACGSSREEERSVELGDRASPQGGEGDAAATGRDGERRDRSG